VAGGVSAPPDGRDTRRSARHPRAHRGPNLRGSVRPAAQHGRAGRRGPGRRESSAVRRVPSAGSTSLLSGSARLSRSPNRSRCTAEPSTWVPRRPSRSCSVRCAPDATQDGWSGWKALRALSSMAGVKQRPSSVTCRSVDRASTPPAKTLRGCGRRVPPRPGRRLDSRAGSRAATGSRTRCTR
jgi:hypothetical protein